MKRMRARVRRRVRVFEASLVAFLVGAIAAGAAAGCSATRSNRVEAPMEVTIPPAGSGAKMTLVTSGESLEGTCTLRLMARAIQKKSPGCYLDEQISTNSGLLHYPCNGEGPATADFGEHHYVGAVHRGELELVFETELDWEDNCRWGTHAVIRGSNLKGADPAVGKLSWDYQDHVVRGSGCSGVCDARTTFRVEGRRNGSAAGGADEHDTEDDDDAD